ncbi:MULTISPECIES: HNH endonuclease [Pectobacterium]|uniref:HNH endonuclease n=1 Tax=Pectobacterium TaxID=122277 RepID=UPI002114A273|nr:MULTISPECIES: HNH endonuclease [Pectobacterium]MDY4366549.1 HNH endonuclease [Pectobacterium brasiliense]MDY7056080.1 HNH endonuclease [Pectobacterium brasiliense]UUE43603.1 HNH endonuclease [Pectobacterium aroidearum]UUE47822.1 HNH endonuclease [Pectobacterium aroidearum]UUE52027.1 HNH endonuclease [Pectobacterium aroidearum]
MESILSRYVLRFDQKNSRIDLGILGQRCIFCNKNYSEKLFNSEAHVISEFLYNKSIFHYNECNDCNDKFKNIERDFSNLIEMDKSLLSMYGKKGVPQVNLSKIKNESRITFNKKQKIPILNNATPNKGYLRINNESGDIVIKNVRNSYYNTNVFKCLTKYALSIMPIELIGNYKILTRFVLQDTDLPYPTGFFFCEKKLSDNVTEVSPSIFQFNGLMLIHKTYFLSAMPFNGIEMKLVNDKNIDGLVVFSVFFGNSAFQIFIPNDKFIYHTVEKIFNNEKPLSTSFPQFTTAEIKYSANNLEITTIDCRIHNKIEKEIDERYFSSVLIPLDKEMLSLDDKGELVIDALKAEINILHIINLWNLKLISLW